MRVKHPGGTPASRAAIPCPRVFRSKRAAWSGRRFPDDDMDHFAFVARIYDRLIPSPDPRRLLALLDLPVAGALLDAGGGTGRASYPLVHLAGVLVVSDLSGAMLAQARRKKGLIPLRAHAERLPFPDECFERVMVVDALHHFCDQREALADLMRVLKTGGRMVIEEPDIERPVVRVVALMEKLFLMGSRFLTANRVAGMVRDAGGRARIERDGRFAYWVAADKPAGGEGIEEWAT